MSVAILWHLPLGNLQPYNGISIDDDESAARQGTEAIRQDFASIGEDYLIAADLLQAAEHDALATPKHQLLPVVDIVQSAGD